MAPSPVLDYIVVHEMCHMVHSKEFSNLVKTVLLDYKKWKDMLKDNGIKYKLWNYAEYFSDNLI